MQKELLEKQINERESPPTPPPPYSASYSYTDQYNQGSDNHTPFSITPQMTPRNSSDNLQQYAIQVNVKKSFYFLFQDCNVFVIF